MTSSAIPMLIRREAAVRPPAAVPTGARIYRRPTPPPSQQHKATPGPTQLPMTPRPIKAPPQLEATIVEPVRGDYVPWRRIVLLVAAIIGLLVIAATTVWMWMPDSIPDAVDLTGTQRQIAQPDATPDTETSTKPNAIAATTTATWFADAALEEMLRDDAPPERESRRLVGAQLLASRFYELQTNADGRVIAASMPADNRNRRFGPTVDEVAALSELPRLEQLDLRDTIASAAIPIANRLPHLKVLILKDQTDSRALENLKLIDELHLINSATAPPSLARRGIHVVYTESR